jgi:hypothetical protein
MLVREKISPEDLDIFKVAATPEEALEIIRNNPVAEP